MYQRSLLELSAAWSDFIDSNPDGASCIGPSSALKTSQERYQKVVDRLKDKDETTIYLVTRPDASALREADRSGKELKEMGLANQLLLINGYFEPVDESDTFDQKMKEMVEDIIDDKEHGLVMTMGKGGVGKTTIAAAIALHLAQKGYPVHLTTTDPAFKTESGCRDSAPGKNGQVTCGSSLLNSLDCGRPCFGNDVKRQHPTKKEK